MKTKTNSPKAQRFELRFVAADDFTILTGYKFITLVGLLHQLRLRLHNLDSYHLTPIGNRVIEVKFVTHEKWLPIPAVNLQLRELSLFAE